MEARYHSLSDPPAEISAANIICRTLAGIGFRFHWATADLADETYAFRPCVDARSIGETVEHIWDLLEWVRQAIALNSKTRPLGARQLRLDVLERIAELEDAFAGMQSRQLASIQILGRTFWPIVNGPLADVLTHIGQISSARRLAGTPVPDSNPFEGTPPSKR